MRLCHKSCDKTHTCTAHGSHRHPRPLPKKTMRDELIGAVLTGIGHGRHCDACVVCADRESASFNTSQSTSTSTQSESP